MPHQRWKYSEYAIGLNRENRRNPPNTVMFPYQRTKGKSQILQREAIKLTPPPLQNWLLSSMNLWELSVFLLKLFEHLQPCHKKTCQLGETTLCAQVQKLARGYSRDFPAFQNLGPGALDFGKE